MAAAPTIAFDVNETLSDLEPLAERFTDVGAPASLLRVWFAAVLRDGNALTITGTPRPFAEVAAGVLEDLWARLGTVSDRSGATEHVLSGFRELPVHPDVVPGIEALAAAGHPLVTLSNGSAGIAQALLERAGIAQHFTAFLSVDDVGVWKPHKRVYDHAATVCEVNPRELVLVAVHPWDVHGAQRAGLRGVWLDRSGAPYPAVFERPDIRLGALPELVSALS